jgi:hypothetical protein
VKKKFTTDEVKNPNIKVSFPGQISTGREYSENRIRYERMLLLFQIIKSSSISLCFEAKLLSLLKHLASIFYIALV